MAYTTAATSNTKEGIGVSITVEQILDRASEWCDPVYLEPHIKEALTVLVSEFGKSNPAPQTVEDFESVCVFHVVGALKVAEILKASPEIMDKPVVKPLFITGLPRTGTTFLQRLLAQDPNGRPLLAWEATQPTPPPTPETYQSDPRIKDYQEGMEYVPSEIQAVHYSAATAPEECALLFNLQFHSTIFFMRFGLPAVRQWFLNADFKAAYGFYKKTLQLLDWHFPKHHWVLKAPSHLMFLDPLLANFPDACIVRTHRTPLEAIPSGMSLNAKLVATGNPVDLEKLGRQTLGGYANRLKIGMAPRNAAQESHIFDVGYKALLADPIGVVRQICDRFGYEFNQTFEDNLIRYIEANPKGKHGKHNYCLQHFGLTEAQVLEVCGSYMDRFQHLL